MKILHCVTDEKFIDGAISLYEQDNRIESHWIHFVKDDISSLKYIKSPKVEIKKLCLFSKIAIEYDFVILHSLPSLPIEQILSIPDSINVIWYAWGYDLYDGYNPLLPLPLYLPKTKRIYQKLNKAPTVAKAIKRKIKKWFLPCQYEKILPRIDYFSGVFPYEYNMLKERYTQFNATSLDFYYASTEFFVKDICPLTIENNMQNIMIGNSANITNNHADVIEMIARYVTLAKDDKVILPLSYGGTERYVSIIKGIVQKCLGNNAIILDKYLPVDEYWSLVSNCRIAIYAHVRQQASDNIFYQLMNGAKVYLTKKSAAFNYLKNLGLNIFSLEDNLQTINIPLTTDEIRSNREILTKLYSVSANIKRVKDINTLLLSKKWSH